MSVENRTVVSLFSGIAGIEKGLARSGWKTALFCERDLAARAVLKARYPGVRLAKDVRALRSLPPAGVLSAGFPCQDLSQCGKGRGIDGPQSSLVAEIFRLLKSCRTKPEWVVLENVPFMLHLDRGKAIETVTTELEELGYKWAYRTLDARAFGVPQRRLRVLIVASKSQDPRTVLFADEAAEPHPAVSPKACGFYWTEGNTGIGWAVDAVPTLKGGSGLGIPSPPALWLRDSNEIVTIDIRDAERLQGFPPNWTRPASELTGRRGDRWKLVGNAVCVKVAEWLGRRLARPGSAANLTTRPLGTTWTGAAYGLSGKRFAVECSKWPIARPAPSISDFLRFPCPSLSVRASGGLLSRVRKSRLRFEPGFVQALEEHFCKIAVTG